MNHDLTALRAWCQRERDWNETMIARHRRDGHPVAGEHRRELVAERDRWLASFDRTVEALRMAFPELCEDLQATIDCACLHESFDVGGAPVPGSLAGERALEPALQKLAAVRAVAAALGQDLPAQLEAVLAALPSDEGSAAGPSIPGEAAS